MTREPRTIPVHVLGDERIHLAPPHFGRLKQGQLKTLCGLVAVTALSPFVMAEEKRARCPVCFRTGKAASTGSERKAGPKTRPKARSA
ncbi:MAG TPA: hypothetical protein VHC42_09655, partial [Rhizomicrobium sp.]|nr:hypothetical protein [Rhizomicrobium sp.]